MDVSSNKDSAKDCDSEEVQEALRQSRLNLQAEIKKVFECRGRQSKKLALWNEWKAKYPPLHVTGLVALANDRISAKRILEWRLGDGNK